MGEGSLQKLAFLLIQCADDLRDSTRPPFSSREQKIWPLTYCYLILVGRTKEPYTPATALASFRAAAIPDQYDKPFDLFSSRYRVTSKMYLRRTTSKVPTARNEFICERPRNPRSVRTPETPGYLIRPQERRKCRTREGLCL